MNQLDFFLSYIKRIMLLLLALIENPDDVDHIPDAISRAYENSQPHIFLIGRAPELT